LEELITRGLVSPVAIDADQWRTRNRKPILGLSAGQPLGLSMATPKAAPILASGVSVINESPEGKGKLKRKNYEQELARPRVELVKTRQRVPVSTNAGFHDPN
jgi:hypothetical protein